jgi:hypothetical protein
MAGAQDAIVLRDNLSVGPCNRDPRAHARLRRRFWKTVAPDLYAETGRETPIHQMIWSTDELAHALARPPRRPVVMWTAPRWTERLALAFAAGPLSLFDDVWLAGAAPHGLGSRNPSSVPRLLRRARRFRVDEDRALVALWRAFVSQTPAKLTHSLRWGTLFFRDLPRVAKVHWNLFPREVRGRLGLSRFDTQLLKDYESPASMADALRRPRGILRFLFEHGDLIVRARRDAWVDRGALEKVETSRAWARDRYVITAFGQRLLRHGLEQPREAPPLFAGGHEIYGRSTWRLRASRIVPP